MTACAHIRHVGTCPACQRAQLARWRVQLQEATERADVSGRWPDASHNRWIPPDLIQRQPPSTLTTIC